MTRSLLLIICPKLMHYAKPLSITLLSLLAFVLAGFGAGYASDQEFTFELEEIEKKSLEWEGYAELRWEHMDINQGSAFSLLNLADDPQSDFDRLVGALQLGGSYSQELYSLQWLLKAAGQQDTLGWSDTADIYTAYATFKPKASTSLSLGKKSYKWGKGYAWNPVGFINRRKDPNNPDEALEGYITAEADFIKSNIGVVQTAALTTVLLPVYDHINDDFGTVNEMNLAAKLYLLLYDTDIDLLLRTGGSRATAYGLDFSRNLLANFEIHGELAWTENQSRLTLGQDGSLQATAEDALAFLIGMRYLSSQNITSIIEYYHNGGGYSQQEMETFYRFALDAGDDLQLAAGSKLLEQARSASLKGYGRAQPGRNYLYARFNQKEPFDILYFTPAITTIVNLEDSSYSLTPELLYTGFTNWEIRLRFSWLSGSSFTEYGEKQNSNKLELRLRYFF